MNPKYFNLILVSIMLFSLIGTGYACSIDLREISLKIRAENDYAETITAEHNQDIDIQLSFKINNVSGNDCSTNITGKVKIFGYRNNEWETVRTASNKNQTLEADEFVFKWTDEFKTNNRYERYKIEGSILEGNNELETKTAFIDVQNNSCSGIKLIIEDFSIDEGRESTRNFRIENNTNQQFTISNPKITFTNTLIKNGSVDYPNTINKYNSQNVRITLNANNVSYDTTISGTFAVSGYLGNTFCSENEIGRKTFSVTVKDTGNNGSNGSGNYYPSNSDCDDLIINTRNIEMNENEAKKELFYLTNNSTKRFEITEISIIENGLDVMLFNHEKYVSPNSIGDIIISLNTGNVFSTKSYEQIMRISGRFSDGKTCTYNNIGEKKFFVTVNDSSNTQTNTFNCENLNISIPNQVNAENSGEISFTISNHTGKKALIYLESNLNLNLGMIAIPTNTTISDKIKFSINTKNEEIVLKPVIEGCNTTPTTILVNNIATGNIENITINTEINFVEDNKVLRIEFNNPTNKNFVGILRANLDKQIIEDRIITIPKGTSYSEIILNNNEKTKGKISFIYNGIEISEEIDEKESPINITGLFSLGIIPSIIGWVLLLIAIVIIISVIMNSEERKKENWEDKKTNENKAK